MIRLLFVLTLCLAAPARADEGPGPRPDPKPESPSSFGAESEEPLPAVAPGDFAGLLRNCDIVRERAVNGRKLCEKDLVRIPFLSAAYLALWAVLMVFFVFVALRQKRMRAEMAVLRERLARLGDTAR